MRYAVLLLVVACGPSVAGKPDDEVGAELTNQVDVVVENRAFDNVIVRVCADQTCRRVVGFVAAGRQGRGVLTYVTDANLVVEVQYIGRDPDLWRSGFLYWITPGICIEVDIQHYDMRRNNSVGRC